jgi:hypothetical protein
MSYPELQTLLSDIFAEINTTNGVPTPSVLWNQYQTTISSLSQELPNEFVQLNSAGISVPKAVEMGRMLHLLRQRRNPGDNGLGRELVGRIRTEVRPRQRPRRAVPTASLADEQQQIALLWPSVSLFSQFQVDGWARVLEAMDTDRGMVILAPTGSGKTEVFLMPIIHRIAQALAHRGAPHRFVLLYPRVPLLKDQLTRIFRYVYYAEQRQQLFERIIIGFQFSGIGARRELTLNNLSVFDRNGVFRVVDRCPICEEGQLAHNPDIRLRNGVSQLQCTSCAASWEVSLARNDHTKAKPHLLVTTAESLDRLYLNPSRDYEEYLKLITGIGFDEVHMYFSLYGAHIHHLVRRIEELRQAPLIKIASSATVANPEVFIGKLFGIDENDLIVHDANADVYEGSREAAGLEVLYFLQSPEGDQVPPPLSTLIQTIMATGHGLLRDDNRSLTFVESLDLAGRISQQLNDADTINRLWAFRTLVPQISFNDLPCPATQPLDCDTHYLQGECWRGMLCGPQCVQDSAGLRVNPLELNVMSSKGRTDFWQGDTVIATSILEVGVDDERIQSTIHYLPPRTVFSFIQRRGRAGRGADYPVAYTTLVLGNQPADQFYFFRRNRLLSGQFELPLNPDNQRVRDLHDRLIIERNLMGTYIRQSNIPNGAWSWVWRRLISCPILWERYSNDFSRLQSLPIPQQKEGIRRWVAEELTKLKDRLNLRFQLRQIQIELPDILGESAALLRQSIEEFLAGNLSLSQVETNLQRLRREIVLLQDDPDLDVALNAVLDDAFEGINGLWKQVRLQTSGPPLQDAQRLHDFFRVLYGLYKEDWVLLSPPDVLKITLQALFYLHLGIEDEGGSCESRVDFFVPGAYFQVVKPVVVELREQARLGFDNGMGQEGGGYFSSTEEPVTLLSSTLVPYFTAYRYFGTNLSTLDIETLGVEDIDDAQGTSTRRVTVQLIDPEGISRNGMLDVQKIGVRPLQTDVGGKQLVRMCPQCHQLYHLNRRQRCHGSVPWIVRLMARPVVDRNYRIGSSPTAVRAITRTFEYLSEIEGQTTIYGSDVEWRRALEQNGDFILIEHRGEFQTRYETAVHYSFPTRGLRWNLGDTVQSILNDAELSMRFENEVRTTAQRNQIPVKEWNAELILHTAAHLLNKAISSLSGVNEQELEYFCDARNNAVVVWERFEGGAGLTEVVRDSLRTDPSAFFEEILSSVLCPIYLAEVTPADGFDARRVALGEAWRFPTGSEFLESIVSEAEAERIVTDTQTQQQQETRESCNRHDGCPVCVQITYCTERRAQPQRVSRFVAEALAERMLSRGVTRTDVESLMGQATQRGIEPPQVLWADQAQEVFDVLVL